MKWHTNLMGLLVIFTVLFSCKRNENLKISNEGDSQEIIDELKIKLNLPEDFLSDIDDSTFQLQFIDGQCTLKLSTLSKNEYLDKMRLNIEEFRVFNGTERMNELSENRVYRLDSCVYYVNLKQDTFAICDSLFDFSGSRFLFKGYTDNFVLIQSRGHKSAKSLLVSESLWEVEKILPFITIFSPRKTHLFSTEWPMSYSNLIGDTFFGQFGRFYIYSFDKSNVIKEFDSFRALKASSDSTLLSSLTVPFFVSENEVYAVMTLFKNGELDDEKTYCVKISLN